MDFEIDLCTTQPEAFGCVSAHFGLGLLHKAMAHHGVRVGVRVRVSVRVRLSDMGLWAGGSSTHTVG